MSKKKAKPRAAAPDLPPPDEPLSAAPSPGVALRRRRTKRLLFLAVVAVFLPLGEVLAYRFRSIVITVRNDTEKPVQNLTVSYPGGSFGADEIKPGGEVSRVVRPDYTFTKNEFSTYRLIVGVRVGDGGIIRHNGLVGTIDYTASEVYTVADSPEGAARLNHTTRPGFPLGTIRDLMTRLKLR